MGVLVCEFDAHLRAIRIRGVAIYVNGHYINVTLRGNKIL